MNSWHYNDRPADLVWPDYGLSAEVHRELTDQIWAELVLGNDDVDEFVELMEDDSPLPEEQLREAFELARQARLRQQTGWSAEETRTNLDRAFDDLGSAGIVARQNFTCCGNCGAAEIGDERDDSRHWRGYVFFHQQDAEGLVEDGSVYLSYGVFPPEDFDEAAYQALSEAERDARWEEAVRDLVNDEVAPRLERHGLEVVWNGSHRTRVLVKGAKLYRPL